MDDAYQSHYRSLACGDRHSLILTDDGKHIYSFGSGKFGQLGTGQTSDVMDSIAHVSTSVSNDQQLSWSEGQSQVRHLACGANHSAALTDTGRLYTWGRQHKGQLGITDTWGASTTSKTATRKRSKEMPCIVKRFLNIEIVYVSCGSDFTLAVDKKRDLWSWGVGSYGNLGHGDTLNRAEPHPVQDMRGRTVIAKAGAKHSIALAVGGNVFSWGHGDNGRLGLDVDGVTSDRGYPFPKIVPRLNDITSIACGEAHSGAVDNSGKVYMWGAGSYGRLGHGSGSDQHIPKCVDSIASLFVVGMACGAFHSMVIVDTNDKGILMGFGDNQYGQLGLGGEIMTQELPREIGGMENASVLEVSCGQYHTLVVVFHSRIGGRVYSFGFAGHGRLGKIGSKRTMEKVPALIQNIKQIGGKMQGRGRRMKRSDMGGEKRVKAVAVGAQHSLAVSENGTLWGWGDNEYGQTGVEGEQNAMSIAIVQEPREIRKLSQYRVEKIACGSEYSLALTRSGDVFAWGRCQESQLGTGIGGSSAQFEPSPTVIQALQDLHVVDIAAGEDHSAAILSSGELYMWGSSDMGKLGYAGSGLIPKRVGGALTKESVTSVSLGMSHSAAVTKSHRLYMWGGGWYGKLGLGNKKNVYTPTLVTGDLRGRLVSVVSCGSYHTLAVCDGDLFAWGRNEGRLGIRNVSEQLTPKRNEFLRSEGTIIVGVCAGEDMNLVYDKYGAVWAWGKGTNGKLGTGDMNIRISDVPLRVKRQGPGRLEDLFLGRSRRETDRRDVSIYANHCAALTSDGRLYMWGCFRSGRTTHNNHECSAKIVSALSTEKTSSDLSGTARTGRRAGATGGDGDDVSTKVDESGVTSNSRSSGGNEEVDSESAAQVGGGVGGTGGTSNASQRASDKRHKTLVSIDKMSNLDELAMISQRWAKEEGSEDRQRELEKLSRAYKDDFAKMHMEIARCAEIRDAVRFQETRIGLLLESTLHSMNGGPRKIDKRTALPEHISMNMNLYEHLVAMLRAHPCYLDTIFDHLFGSEQNSWTNATGSGAAGKESKASRGSDVDDDMSIRIRDKNSFKDLVLSIYGDLSDRANEHLFLATLTCICRRQFKTVDLDAEISEGSAGTGVFEKLVEDYFKSPHLSEQITKQLDSLLDDLYVFSQEEIHWLSNAHKHTIVHPHRYKPGDNGGVSLVTNPREIDSRGAGVISEGSKDIDLYNQKQNVKEDVDKVVTTLRRICNSWFNQLSRLITKLNTTVKYVCRLRANVYERMLDGDGRNDAVKLIVGRKMGTFIVNFLIKPALKNIEANRARKPTRDQTRNRKKVLAVLYRIIANRRYEKDKQPWMRPINQLIANKQKECWTMIQNVCTVPKDFLALELKVDLYKAPLCMTAMAVQNIRVKDILYLRDVLSFCKEQLTPYNYIHETTLDLLSKSEVQEAMKDGVNGEFLNRSVNLRIDHCLWHETSRDGREGSAAFGECMACNVPLVRKLLPLSQKPLTDVPDLPAKPTDMENAFVITMKELDDFSKRDAGRTLTKEGFVDSVKKLKANALRFNMEQKAMMYESVLKQVEKEDLKMLLRKACRTTGYRHIARDEFDKVIAKKMEISSEISKYRDRMKKKQTALERFLTICREGQKDEKNRQMIKKYAPSTANLSADNFVASQQLVGTGRTDPLKKALKKMKASVGQHCIVSFQEMKKCGAVVDIVSKSELMLSKAKIQAGTKFHLNMSGAVVHLRMIYAESLVLYEIKFTLEDLISASKQNRETISPRSQHDDEGSGVASTEQQSYINAKFNVLGLIEFVKKKLILPDLLYA